MAQSFCSRGRCYFRVSTPLLQARWAIWFAALTLLAVDSAAAFLFGTNQNAFFAVNNTVLLLIGWGRPTCGHRAG
jgi:hypothetical protein